MSEEKFEIPEHLLKRSAEAKAKALGVPVEQVLEEMKSRHLEIIPFQELGVHLL